MVILWVFSSSVTAILQSHYRLHVSLSVEPGIGPWAKTETQLVLHPAHWHGVWSSHRPPKLPSSQLNARKLVLVQSTPGAWSICHCLILFHIDTNHNLNQHAFNIKYLANLIKKHWTCFRNQKLTNSLVCFPPSVCVQVRRPSWRICSRIQVSFGFWVCSLDLWQLFPKVGCWLDYSE